MEWQWFVLELNPEPWAIGPLSVGRKNGKMFPMVGRNTQLHYYKEAVKSEMISKYGDLDFYTGTIELQFYFWRTRDEYLTPQARTHRKHEADLTNLQKATEDALQDILFENDKDVKIVHSHMVEQGPDIAPAVVIGIRPASRFISLADLPSDVIAELEEIRNQESEGNDWL